MNRIGKIFAAVFLLLVFLAWGVVRFYLPGYLKDEAALFGQQVGYKISLSDVVISPFQLKADVSGIELTAANGQHLLKMASLSVDADFWPLLMGKVSLANVHIEQPELLLSRADTDATNKAPSWNWAQFVSAVAQATQPEESVESKPIKLAIHSLAIQGARLSVRDGLKKAPINLGPMDLTLEDFSNQDSEGVVGGLRSGFTINLGAVKIPLPSQQDVPARALEFKKVVASGRADRHAHEAMVIRLDLGLDDGKVSSVWQMNDHQAGISGSITLAQVSVSPWLAALPSYQRLVSPTGLLNGDFKIAQSNDGLAVDGDFAIAGMSAQVDGAKETLLGWTNASVNQLHLVLPTDSNKAGVVSINDIVIDQPNLRFVINAQRRSNFREVFSQPTPLAAETVQAPVSSPALAKSGPEFRFDIHSVRIKNGTMFFADESIKPAFRVDVNELNGYLQGISNGPGRYASVSIDGRAAKSGGLKIRGQLAFADPRQNNDISMIFRNIPLNTTNPYAMTFAGYAIDDGRIDANLRYVTKDGQLDGKNRFVIKKIKLGAPVADYEGTRLPLGLAIALLEDSDGMIDVNIPVKGNVNEPEFSVGHLVWQAFRTLLANVATAPFKVLGALLGIENMESMVFVPGESALSPADDEKLEKFAALLVKRPKSKLVIIGTYDPAVDAPALARAMADRAILQASGFNIAINEPLPSPNLTDPKIKSGLKSAYAAQAGRIQLGQRLLTLPDTAERDVQLRSELIQSYKITDVQLMQLAEQRAVAVREKMVAVDAKLSDRINIAQPEAVAAEQEGIPLRIQLESGS